MTAMDARMVMRTRAAKVLTEVFAPPILVLTLLLVVGIHSIQRRQGPAPGCGRDVLRRRPALRDHAGWHSQRPPFGSSSEPARPAAGHDDHRPCVRIGGPVGDGLAGRSARTVRSVAAMVAGVGVALVISSFWKISIHAACAAGTVAILVVVFGWIMLIWVPVVAAICWVVSHPGSHRPAGRGRIRGRRHSGDGSDGPPGLSGHKRTWHAVGCILNCRPGAATLARSCRRQVTR